MTSNSRLGNLATPKNTKGSAPTADNRCDHCWERWRGVEFMKGFDIMHCLKCFTDVAVDPQADSTNLVHSLGGTLHEVNTVVNSKAREG